MTSLTVLSIGFRVSTAALSITSPVLKRLLAAAKPMPTSKPEAKPTKVLALTGDSVSSLRTLLNVLHLRNDALPSRMEPTEISRYVEVAVKYQCIPAACRAASPWFDHIYTRYPDPPLYEMVQATMVLGDAVYFARFSSRWVLHAPLTQMLTPTVPLTPPQANLSRALLQRQRDGFQALHTDIDDLVGPCADAFASDNTHFVDSPPGDDPTPVDLGGDPNPVQCVVDKEGAVEYLAALRDAKLWPANLWPNTNLLAVTEAVDKFQIPEYDASQNCHYCAHIEDEFAEGVSELKQELNRRLWGLCLECFKNKNIKAGECTYEHAKPRMLTLVTNVKGNASGRQV